MGVPLFGVFWGFWFPAFAEARTVCVCGVWGLGLLFENYIVDASILRHAPVLRVCVDSNFFEGPWPFVGRGSLELVFDLCGQVFKGTRWMPWHQEPMKDVGICDKPGGVDNRAVIPGCPNGETPHNAVR